MSDSANDGDLLLLMGNDDEGAGAGVDNLLLETDDNLLLEDGTSVLLLE